MNREKTIQRLKTTPYDCLVIGGGATGAGIALDAASRGLKVALVERNDFASGTSSRSTKLIHGGVRYLEKAVLKFDRSQFKLVREALSERATLLRIAPHLCHPLPLLTPLYNTWQVPYYRTGLKLYDRLAGKKKIQKSYFVSTKEALDRFPMLKPKNLRGGVIYYDGQFDDARMNVSIAMTATEHGADCLNHASVTALKTKEKKITGVSVRDELSGDTWEISSKVVVNATGPFGDDIRKLDNPTATPLLKASSGVHIVLSKTFSPPDTGLLIPKTADGRVLFLLPWQGYTLVGTTDNPAPIESNPKPSEKDIEFILHELNRYFQTTVKRDDVLSAWSGLRPLVCNEKSTETAALSRDHYILVSDSGLITIAGGKWTTYRKMAEDTVDEAIRVGELKPEKTCHTNEILLVGAKHYSKSDTQKLQQQYKLPEDIAHHLNGAYGDRALAVAEMGRKEDMLNRLHPAHPYLAVEVVYAIRHESARTIVDVLARRLRLAFLDREATKKTIEQVALRLKQELSLSDKALKKLIEQAYDEC